MEYLVNDLVLKLENMQFLFVFESPYLNELYYQVPLAGKSGRNVTNFLLKKHIKHLAIPPNYPFGSYLSNYHDERFGIMNCSNQPLDKKVYMNLSVNIDEQKIALDRIRKNPSTKFMNRDLPIDKELHSKLQSDFEKRLNSYIYKNEKLIIIACGKLAENFINTAISHNPRIFNEENVIMVPHPSFNLWDRIVYQNHLHKMVQIINDNIVAFTPSMASKQM